MTIRRARAADGAAIASLQRRTWQATYRGMQRAGIGRGLHEAAVASLAGSGFSEAILWVAEANGSARAFYEKHGWAHDGAAKVWRGAVVVRYRRGL